MDDDKKPVSMPLLQAEGIVTIFDKDGNVKAELPITSIEFNEDLEDAARNST